MNVNAIAQHINDINFNFIVGIVVDGEKPNLFISSSSVDYDEYFINQDIHNIQFVETFLPSIPEYDTLSDIDMCQLLKSIYGYTVVTMEPELIDEYLNTTISLDENWAQHYDICYDDVIKIAQHIVGLRLNYLEAIIEQKKDTPRHRELKTLFERIKQELDEKQGYVWKGWVCSHLVGMKSMFCKAMEKQFERCNLMFRIKWFLKKRKGNTNV